MQSFFVGSKWHGHENSKLIYTHICRSNVIFGYFDISKNQVIFLDRCWQIREVYIILIIKIVEKQFNDLLVQNG